MDHSKYSLRGLLLITALALCLIAPARLQFFSWEQGAFSRTPFPTSVQPIKINNAVDLNNDGQLEQVTLKNSIVTIETDDTLLWSSPPNWEVKQVEVTDLDHDGQPEVTLLLWRDFAPWPIDDYLVHPGRIQNFHDRRSDSCHLILIGWRQQAFREIWAGSALADPLLTFATADLDKDGRDELIALEGRYDDHLGLNNAVTVWQWNGFGFTLLSRGPQGYIQTLRVVRSIYKANLLLVQGISWR
jgi:hypothetical protein